MENKYYTPTIEEFYVGFEYVKIMEDNDGNEFIECHEIDHPDDIFYATTNESVRVKHLDLEDIENLGWFLDGFGYPDYKINKVQLMYNFQILAEFNLELYTNSKIIVSDIEKDNVFFQGIVKNKSELEKLMIQLGINN